MPLHQDITDINPPIESRQKNNRWLATTLGIDTAKTALGFAFVGILCLWTRDSALITDRMEHDLDSLNRAAAVMIENNIVTQDSAGVPVQRLVMNDRTLQEYKKTMEMAKIKAWQLATPFANENDKPEIK